jgi:hypothetical protein
VTCLDGSSVTIVIGNALKLAPSAASISVRATRIASSPKEAHEWDWSAAGSLEELSGTA